MTAWKTAELTFQQSVAPAVTVIAVGGGAMLIGSLIAGLSEGGLTPGVGILCLGTVAFAWGLVWSRRVARRHRFRLTYRSSVPLLLLMLASCAIAIGVSLAVGAFLGVAGGIFIALLVPPIVRLYVGLRTAVLLSHPGIQIAYQRLPWTAVQHVLVADSGSGRDVTVGVRLRAGAQVPDEVHLTDPNPPHRDAPHLDVAVPRRRVRNRNLAAAIAHFAPRGTQVVGTGAPPRGEVTS